MSNEQKNGDGNREEILRQEEEEAEGVSNIYRDEFREVGAAEDPETADKEQEPSPAENAEGEKTPASAGGAPASGPKQWHPPKRTLVATAGLMVIFFLGLFLILYAWGLTPFQYGRVTTDNAYVRGRTTVISPQVTGYVTHVYVQDFDDVKAGQPLVRIDDRTYREKVAQAQAEVHGQSANLDNYGQSHRSKEAAAAAKAAAVANAEAQLEKARADMRRVDELTAGGSLSLRERDQTRAVLKQAQTGLAEAQAQYRIAVEDVKSTQVGRGGLTANVSAADARLAQAKIDLDNTVVRAPENGRLSEIGVKNGQLVNAGTQLMFLVPAQKWIVANFKEAQITDIRVGQKAVFRVDALGGAKIGGVVEKISPAAGSEFSVIKPDTATGNFVKVPQRIAVRIRINEKDPLAARLRPGMSVEVTVDTGTGTISSGSAS